MKFLFTKLCFLPVLFLLLSVGYAFSMPIPGTDKVWITSTSMGYEIDVSDDGTVDYIGFCLEKDIVYYPLLHDVDSVEKYATSGGPGAEDIGGIQGDYLSDETNWVYWEYTFGGYFGLTKDSTLATRVQNFIWYQEDEILTPGEITDAQNFYYSYVDGNDYSTAGWTIKALNIGFYTSGVFTEEQSMIIGEPVPEPATMLLFGTGLIGLAAFARRRSKK